MGGMPIFEPTEISYTVGHIYISLYPLHPYCSWISTVFMAYVQLYLYQHPMKMCPFIGYIPINTSLIFPMKPLRHFPRIKGSLLSVAWIFRTQSCHRRASRGWVSLLEMTHKQKHGVSKRAEITKIVRIPGCFS